MYTGCRCSDVVSIHTCDRDQSSGEEAWTDPQREEAPQGLGQIRESKERKGAGRNGGKGEPGVIFPRQQNDCVGINDFKLESLPHPLYKLSILALEAGRETRTICVYQQL